MADRVFLTGATGFVGSHVLRELLAAGYEVTALRRAASRDGGDAVTWIEGDLQNAGAFARALDGCRYVVHTAARYSFAPGERRAMHAINVAGTASLAEAAHLAGVERFVLTSSSATLGASAGGRPRTEMDWAAGGPSSGYHHSKVEQERAAFAGRVPAIALLPTAPVGPGDWKPTPTGKMIVDFARGKMFSKPPQGGMNVVPVEDVARAHVAALTRGRSGERYILGGRNVSLDHLWELLAELTGKPLPSWRAPYGLMLAIAYADEVRCRVVRGAQPFAPLEGVRMSRTRMFADSSKAERELQWRPGDVGAALGRAIDWYRAHGYA